MFHVEYDQVLCVNKYMYKKEYKLYKQECSDVISMYLLAWKTLNNSSRHYSLNIMEVSTIDIPNL